MRERSLNSNDLYKWPEFKALCDRLGIQWAARTKRLLILMNADETVHIEHSYAADDPTAPLKPVHSETAVNLDVEMPPVVIVEDCK
jgi:hypothetical protein